MLVAVYDHFHILLDNFVIMKVALKNAKFK